MNSTKAVFWDRDGVLNHVLKERGDGKKNVSPQKFEDFKLVEGLTEILNKTKELGYLNIVITNQPDIARSKMSWDELNKMHDFLKIHLPTIVAIYVCPHDKEDNCNCRKPKPGLILDAQKDYHINLGQSFVVGDSQKDIDAAKNAGVKSVFKKTHYNGDVMGFNFEIKNLEEIFPLLS